MQLLNDWAHTTLKKLKLKFRFYFKKTSIYKQQIK